MICYWTDARQHGIHLLMIQMILRHSTTAKPTTTSKATVTILLKPVYWFGSRGECTVRSRVHIRVIYESFAGLRRKDFLRFSVPNSADVTSKYSCCKQNALRPQGNTVISLKANLKTQGKNSNTIGKILIFHVATCFYPSYPQPNTFICSFRKLIYRISQA